MKIIKVERKFKNTYQVGLIEQEEEDKADKEHHDRRIYALNMVKYPMKFSKNLLIKSRSLSL